MRNLKDTEEKKRVKNDLKIFKNRNKMEERNL